MNDTGLLGFDLYFPQEYLKAALTISLLSVWVLVGLFYYLNRYTKRRYFTIWTAAWLFYALWLTLCLSMSSGADQPLLVMLKQWCVGSAGVFLLWGGARFLKQKTPQRLFGLFLAFLLAWSYVGAYHLEDPFWAQMPIFGLIGIASLMTALCFYKLRLKRSFIGAGLLSFGFLLWGFYLGCYPLIQLNPEYITSGFFISAVLQLFIAVSMIVLVLEEVRTTNQLAMEQVRQQRTETAALRQKVEASEGRYRCLFDQANEGIIIAGTGDLRILEMNQTARRLLGVSGSEGAHSLRAYCHFLGDQQAPTAAGEWFEALCRERQIQLVRRNGATTAAEIEGTIIDFEGQPAFQVFLRELTDRSRLEQQLRQAEKLSAMGHMISGIAHELNNPLAVIKGYLELVLSKHELCPQTRADLEKVAQESNRAAKLVLNFLSFAREQPVNRQLVSVNDLIHQVCELRRYDFKVAGVETILDLQDDLPKTMADSDQLQQVLVNLIQNGLHALVEVDGPRRIRLATSQLGDVVQIAVEDNGPGIPLSIQAHIFEPFYTTKQVGTGTGLGLSIAHSIMTDHQGRIYYEPAEPRGALFVLELPLTGETPAVPNTTAGERKPARHIEPIVAHARVLVLDDEGAIADLLGEMLSLLGHEPTVCNSPLQALEVVRAQEFDAILSDFRMPNMNGQQFYEAAVAARPELARRFIFLTGDVVNEETQGWLKSAGAVNLAKPFQLSRVEEALHSVLGEPLRRVSN